VITETILNNNDDFEVLQVFSFAAPCPTRFGSQIFCLRDVQRSKDALKSAVLDDGWNDATSNVTARDKIHQMLTGGNNTNFFADTTTVLKVTQPIMDAIHTVEADKPLLSQMLPLWAELLNCMQELHDNGSAALKRAKLPELLKERRDKLWHPSFSAAYLLDPINFVTCFDGT
jgi:hypothetical protein